MKNIGIERGIFSGRLMRRMVLFVCLATAATLLVIQRPTPAGADTVPKLAYHPDCQRPANHDDADYCLQVSLASMNHTQTVAGIIGVGAVLITLLLSGYSSFAARTAVGAATRSAKAAEESGYIERAWLVHDRFGHTTVKNATVSGSPGHNGYSIEHSWLNGGRTPAIKVRAVLMYKILQINEELPEFTVSNEQMASARLYPPFGQGQVSMNNRSFISKEDWDAVESKTKKIAVYGRVEYRDVYQPNLVRKSEICGYIHPNGTRQLPGRPAEPVIAFMSEGEQNTCS